MSSAVFDGYVRADGYWVESGVLLDGYNVTDGYVSNLQYFAVGPRPIYTNQLNIKLTEEDIKHMAEINKEFFENEASNSMLGRILLRKGIAFYTKLKS